MTATETLADAPCVLDMEASGFGRHSYPVEVGVALPDGREEIDPAFEAQTDLPLIELPAGFSYKSYGWRGDIMSDGLPTPGAHDGMGVVVSRRVGRSTEIILVRNHEQSTSSNAANIIGGSRSNVAKYDTGLTGTNYQIGGNTNLIWRDGNWVGSHASSRMLTEICKSMCYRGALKWLILR